MHISLYISSMSTSVSSMCIYNVLLSFYLFWYIINTYCQRNNESEYETTVRSIKKSRSGFLLTFNFACLYRSGGLLFWGLATINISLFNFSHSGSHHTVSCSFINTPDASRLWGSHKGIYSRLQWWNITFVRTNTSEIPLLNKTNRSLNILW